MNEPTRQPDDLDVDAAPFWLDTDLETMLANVKPYEGPDEFVIDDLHDAEARYGRYALAGAARSRFFRQPAQTQSDGNE